MKNVLSIYKSGEIIPFLIIRCDSYESDKNGFHIRRGSDKWFLPIDWDWFTQIEVGENGKEIASLFENFQDKIEKYE